MNNTSENLQTSIRTNVLVGLFTLPSFWRWQQIVPLEAQVSKKSEAQEKITNTPLW